MVLLKYPVKLEVPEKNKSMPKLPRLWIFLCQNYLNFHFSQMMRHCGPLSYIRA